MEGRARVNGSRQPGLMLKLPGTTAERRNPCALHSEVRHTAGLASATQPPRPLVPSSSDWSFLWFALSCLGPEGIFEASKDGQGQSRCYSLLYKGSAFFHTLTLWGSFLCLPAPAPLAVPAVSVSFHSQQGVGLHCSYEPTLCSLQTLGPSPTRAISPR